MTLNPASSVIIELSESLKTLEDTLEKVTQQAKAQRDEMKKFENRMKERQKRFKDPMFRLQYQLRSLDRILREQPVFKNLYY